MAPFRFPSAILLLVLSFISASWQNCPGLPYSVSECSGKGLSSPPHLMAFFASSNLPSSIPITYSLDVCDSVTRTTVVYSINDQQYFSNVTAVYYSADTSFSLSIPTPTDNARFEWFVFRECWEVKNGNGNRKRGLPGEMMSVLSKAVTPTTVYNLPPIGYITATGWKLKSSCWVSDKDSSRTGIYYCSRVYYFCKRQADTSPESPANASVIQGAKTITFRWTDITPSEPACVSQATSFQYVFSLWNTTSTPSSSTPPFFTVNLPLTPTYVLNTTSISPGTYYWSVRSNRVVPASQVIGVGSTPTTTTIYLAYRTFKLCGPDVAPSVTTLLSPANGTLTQTASIIPEAGVSTASVTVTWQLPDFGLTCYPSANSFEVAFAQNSAFTLGLKKFTLVGTETSLTKNFADGTWYWRVTASNGVLSSVSKTFSFNICLLVPPTAFSTLTPENNIKDIPYSFVPFTWGTSSRVSSCATNQITYSLYTGAPGGTFSLNYTGPLTSFNGSVAKGTWSWYVEAADSLGQVRRTPTVSFVTVSSECQPVPPTPPTLLPEVFEWVTNAVEVSFAWTAPNLGVTCNSTRRRAVSAASLNLVITHSDNSPYANISLGVDNLNYSSSFPAGDYIWYLIVSNGNQANSSSPRTFTVCETASLPDFATDFTPADNILVTDGSLSRITWAFIGPQYSCLGGLARYVLQLEGPSDIYLTLPDQSVTSYSISNLRTGTWTWTLSNDLSEIPIANLPTASYTFTFRTCTPTIPLAPALVEPRLFSVNVGSSVTLRWNHTRALLDTCTPYYNESLLEERFTYSFISSRTSSFSSSVPQVAQVVFRGQPTVFELAVGNLTAGFLYWKMRVTKEVLVGTNAQVTMSKDSSPSLFSICLNSVPSAPVPLFPSNGTVFERCNISTSFAWAPVDFSQFGIDCSPSPSFGIRVFVGRDPSNLTEFIYSVLYTQAATGSVSVINGYSPKTTYFWQVEAFNSHSATRSEIFSFTSPDTTVVACSGHGSCNAQGTCDCNPNWQGLVCSQAAPTEPPPSTSPGRADAGFPVGAVAGSVAGGLLALLVLAFIGFVYLKRRAEQSLLKPERTPPEFPPLAFNPPAGYPPLNQEKIVPWYSFEQLLGVYGFALSFATLDVTQATEIDDVTKSLVYVIESKRQGGAFVKALISKDLREKSESNNLSSATLFRDNSHASKAFKTYAKIVALPYLFYVFGDAVYDLCTKDLSSQPEEASSKSSKRRSATHSGIELKEVVVKRTSTRNVSNLFDAGSLEVDPNKMKDGDDSLANAILLQLRCQKLLVRVFRSISIFPQAFLDIFNHLMVEVQTYLSKEDGYNSIASFLFLRLLNPSILFPHHYGLLEASPDNENLTRQLILITKVLQNLANGVHFGNKELHMVPMNDFIDSNKDTLRDFLDSILSKYNELEEPEEVPTSGPNLIPAAFNSNVNSDKKKKKKKKKAEDQDEFFRPLEVPRQAVETSLTLIYNQLYRNKERVFEALQKYRSPDDVKIIINKCTAIMAEIGEPIPRNLTDKR